MLEHPESLGSNETLSDANLTHKLAMLLALTTANRASEIQGMDLEFMLDKGEEIMFTIPKLTKTMRAGQKPHTVTLVQYEKKRTRRGVLCKSIRQTNTLLENNKGEAQTSSKHHSSSQISSNKHNC